ncbi:MAG TPA: hypothetical protein VEX37_04280 [Thermomicrobiales bacterium]|nr:hypothetical protein [Thermomicrobiales bacterium]
MILLMGIPSETPLALVASRLDELAIPYVMFNQRRFFATDVELAIDSSGVTGRLTIDGQTHRLEDFTGVYTRLMDDRALPELKGLPASSPLRSHCRAVHELLTHWCDVAQARVVNRMGPMGSNGSKPYQAQLIRQYGFLTPETLITNDPAEVRAFLTLHGRLIYKSISGIRSIVRTFSDADESRLEAIRWCPTQFQAFVHGTDVRVHTIGEHAFATAIESDATDYRYATRQGTDAELTPVELPEELSQRCARLAAGLGLAFAGIDLRLTPDGDAYCFEVNPCPAYSYYEAHTDQPIALALAKYLAGLD